MVIFLSLCIFSNFWLCARLVYDRPYRLQTVLLSWQGSHFFLSVPQIGEDKSGIELFKAVLKFNKTQFSYHLSCWVVLFCFAFLNWKPSICILNPKRLLETHVYRAAQRSSQVGLPALLQNLSVAVNSKFPRYKKMAIAPSYSVTSFLYMFPEILC